MKCPIFSYFTLPDRSGYDYLAGFLSKIREHTWMRVLLTNYLRDGDTPADINKLDGGSIASARKWFDEWVGIEASALDDVIVERLRPDVYRGMAGESPDTIYMKVHDAWGRTDGGQPLFPTDITAGVVYIIRNPLDVVTSAAHHWGSGTEKEVENVCDPDFTLSSSSKGLSDQLRQNMRSWSGHVRSWIDESGLPVYPVRYEDMLQDSETAFKGVVQFCGLECNDDRIRKAVASRIFLNCSARNGRRDFGNARN